MNIFYLFGHFLREWRSLSDKFLTLKSLSGQICYDFFIVMTFWNQGWIKQQLRNENLNEKSKSLTLIAFFIEYFE